MLKREKEEANEEEEGTKRLVGQSSEKCAEKEAMLSVRSSSIER